MALVRTSLSSAVSVDDTSIVVALATGFAAGYQVLVDGESMVVQSNYVSGTTIPVRRGQNGTATVAHVVTAAVTCGTVSDWPDVPIGQFTSYQPAGRAVRLVSVTATSSLTLPQAAEDLRVIINATSAITLTVPVPTKEMDGMMLTIASSAASVANIITFTGGSAGAGTNYDVFTAQASFPVALSAIACNSVWIVLSQVPIAGTVTNILTTVT